MSNVSDRTIWTGDNLDILRGLNSASVDLVYLDPPFNSNRNYAAPVGSAAAGVAVGQRCLHCASEGRLRATAGFLQSRP